MLDTNVLVSGLRSKRGASFRLLQLLGTPNWRPCVSVPVEVQFRIRPALRDPDDDRILELAARPGATIVTFNNRDFEGAEAFGVRVLRPVEFLRQIGEIR